ncbi:MAG: hypothetical protein M5U26_26425 [Planctomycetota bacterium]|nr:hypothetical protein [Planctomycetota bacterium]
MRRALSCSLGFALLALASGCGQPRTPAAPSVQTVPADKALVLSGRSTSVFHFCSCAYAKDIPPREQLGYASPDDAERAGKIPCTHCKPRDAYAEYLRSRDEEPAAPAPPVEGPR